MDTVKKQTAGNASAAKGPIKNAGALCLGFGGCLFLLCRIRALRAVLHARFAAERAIADPPMLPLNAAKLENDTETFEHERVSSELKKQIQSARLAKKLTQAQVGVRSGVVVEAALGSASHNGRLAERCFCLPACSLHK